jgi:hypothetical protein
MSGPTGGPGITTHRAYKTFCLATLDAALAVIPLPKAFEPPQHHVNNPVCRQLVATYSYPCLGRFPPSTCSPSN